MRMARIRENREVPPGEVGGPFELAPDMLAALRYYEAHAPAALAAPEPWPAVRRTPVVRAAALTPPGAPPTPVVSDVELVDLDGDARLELVVCDMRHGMVFLGRPYHPAGGPHADRAAVEPGPQPGRRSRSRRDQGSAGGRPRRVPAARSRQRRGRLAAGTGRRAGSHPRRSAACHVSPTSRPPISTATATSICWSAPLAIGRPAACRFSRTARPIGVRPAFTPLTIDPRPGAVRAIPTRRRSRRPDRRDRRAVAGTRSGDPVPQRRRPLTFRPQVMYRRRTRTGVHPECRWPISTAMATPTSCLQTATRSTTAC